MRALLVIMASLLVVSCAAPGEKLIQLRAQTFTQDDFATVLAKEYIAYADALSERGHPIRADRFAAKGLAALAGEAVLPEEATALARERKMLLQLLTDDVKDIAPDKAARAQLLFDCWADEAGRIGDKDVICRDSFEGALADVQFIADTLVHGNENRFVIRFSPSSFALSDEAKTVLAIIAKRTQTLGVYKVELMSYTKHPKASAKVKLLANRRMIVIEKNLIESGVHAGKIHRHAATSNSEVFIAVDAVSGNENAIGVSIQTFGQADEAKTP